MTHEESGKLELLFAHLSINDVTSIKPLLLDALDEYYTIQTRLSYGEKQEVNFIKRLLFHVEREEWIQAREHLNAAQTAYKTYILNKTTTEGYSRKLGYSQIHGKGSTQNDDSHILEIEWSRELDKPVRQAGSTSKYEDKGTYCKVPKVENRYHAWKGSNLGKQYVIQYRSPAAEEQGPEVKASFLKSSARSYDTYPGSYSRSHKTSSLKINEAVVDTSNSITCPPKEITSYSSKKADTDAVFDPIKPYYIAEAYHNLYEIEWHKALSSLHRQSVLEESAIECLLYILHEAYALCEEEARSQIVRLEHAAWNIISDGKYTTYDKAISGQTGNIQHMLRYRKELSELSVKRLQDIFLLKFLPNVHRRFNVKSSAALDEYSGQCVVVSWRMVIQEPPLHLDFIDPGIDQQFDAKTYKPYRRSGNRIECVVWPTLRIYRNGLVLCRGIVRCN